jgi:hypothetical protein
VSVGVESEADPEPSDAVDDTAPPSEEEEDRSGPLDEPPSETVAAVAPWLDPPLDPDEPPLDPDEPPLDPDEPPVDSDEPPLPDLPEPPELESSPERVVVPEVGPPSEPVDPPRSWDESPLDDPSPEPPS